MAKKALVEQKQIRNKKARFNYEILDRVEAGIALTGTEVKSLRNGKASLDEAYAIIQGGQVTLIDCHISPYEQASVAAHEPLRRRRLLLHKREIRKLQPKVTLRGQTLVPLAIYFNKRGLAKVELALVRGKTHGDKRQRIKEREHQREMERAARRRR
jgi:SsrA-binding protein